MSSWQTIWTRTAAWITGRTSAATMENASVEHVSARKEKTQRRYTAESSASVTTSAVTAPTTSSAEVQPIENLHFCLLPYLIVVNEFWHLGICSGKPDKNTCYWGILLPTGHGRCECKKCICDANYKGSACECPLDNSTCLTSNKLICNNRGSCECGVCKCTDKKYEGPTCEICPTCPKICSEHKWVIGWILANEFRLTYLT